jgi:hypothetical protein
MRQIRAALVLMPVLLSVLAGCHRFGTERMTPAPLSPAPSVTMPTRWSPDRESAPDRARRCAAAPALLDSARSGYYEYHLRRALIGCPGTSALLAARVRAGRTAEAAPLQLPLRISEGVRDADLFAAALEVAADRGAGAPARVAALVIAFRQVNPDDHTLILFEGLRRMADHMAANAAITASGGRVSTVPLCPLAWVDHPAARVTGRPVPAGARDALAAVLRDVRAEAAAPAHVRAAAECVRAALRS